MSREVDAEFELFTLISGNLTCSLIPFDELPLLYETVYVGGKSHNFAFHQPTH